MALEIDAPTSELYTIDNLLRARAEVESSPPFLAYPRTRQGLKDYEIFSTLDLHNLVDGAAKCLIKRGFAPAVC